MSVLFGLDLHIHGENHHAAKSKPNNTDKFYNSYNQYKFYNFHILHKNSNHYRVCKNHSHYNWYSYCNYNNFHYHLYETYNYLPIIKEAGGLVGVSVSEDAEPCILHNIKQHLPGLPWGQRTNGKQTSVKHSSQQQKQT